MRDRLYIAVKAMAICPIPTNGNVYDKQDFAEWCFEMADAMLEEGWNEKRDNIKGEESDNENEA